MNELSPLAKCIYSLAINDTQWFTLFGTRFREEIIPVNVKVVDPIAMFVSNNHSDIRGAFGFRLFTRSIVQIKAVVEGDDFSKIEQCADIIDRLFDWQNQLLDPFGNPVTNTKIGMPRTNFLWIDPVTPTIKLRIMCMIRNAPLKYCTFADGVNYCHLGGEYEIEYYNE